MIRTRSEKILFSVVLILAIGLGGLYVYRNYGDDLFGGNTNLESRIASIEEMQQVRDQSAEIQKRYEQLKSELELEGSDSEQMQSFRTEITTILEQLNIGKSYQDLVSREPRREDDFKIISISIEQLQCSPQVLGQFLYQLEGQSEVIEVEKCVINNLVSDTGQLSRQFQSLSSPNGLLAVDLQISRLVEYRPGEAPERRRSS